MCIVVTSTQSFHWVVLLFYITGGCRVSKLRPNLSRYKILSGPQLGVRVDINGVLDGRGTLIRTLMGTLM